MLKIVARAEQKYGYKPGEHQRVIVEHILNGRQHFHVMWSRVSLTTNRAVWPGEHWKKSKQVCREMEKELGLKRPVPRKTKRMWAAAIQTGRLSRQIGRYQTLYMKPITVPPISRLIIGPTSKPPQPLPPLPYWMLLRRRKKDENVPDSEKPILGKTREQELLETLIWAWENKRIDVLASFGINLPGDYFEP